MENVRIEYMNDGGTADKSDDIVNVFKAMGYELMGANSQDPDTKIQVMEFNRFDLHFVAEDSKNTAP